MSKPKVAFYWCASCGGCEETVVDLAEDILGVVEKVDIDSLVRNTELGAIIAQSTTGVASEALDVARSQGVGLDNVLSRAVDRVLRRDGSNRPVGPPLLVGQPEPADDAPADAPAPDAGTPAPPGENP